MKISRESMEAYVAMLPVGSRFKVINNNPNWAGSFMSPGDIVETTESCSAETKMKNHRTSESRRWHNDWRDFYVLAVCKKHF